MWWIIHKQWLDDELRLLGTSHIYSQEYQFLNKLLVSTGALIIRRKNTSRYPILIVYPKSTPYSLPHIFLLKKPLKKEEVEQISNLSETNVSAYVEDKVNIVYHRHQNEDGSICIIESDNLYRDRAEPISIANILDRIKTWLIGLEKGTVPKDNREVEYFVHYPKKVKGLYFLLPDIFYDEEYIIGELILSLNFNIPEFSLKTFIGVFIVGTGSNRLSVLPKYYHNKQHLLFSSCPNVMDILKNNESLEEQIKSGKIIKVFWWDKEKEPIPFKESRDLIEYLGNGDFEDGIKELSQNRPEVFDNIIRARSIFYLGIRFRNRKEEKEWIIFQLRKYRELEFSELDEFSKILSNYEIYAVFSERFDDIYFHKRNSGRAERSILKDKHVSLIGCGALGSEVADCLGKAGVGNLKLIDNQNIYAHNVIRHTQRLNRIGLPKTFATLSDLILHNPYLNVYDFPENVLIKHICEYTEAGGIGISSIADDNIESYINQQAVINNRTIFYSRVLRGGKAGRIIRVIPGKDACLNCLALYSGENNKEYKKIPPDESLPTITNECNNPVRPASASDIKLVAAITSRILIDHLQNGESNKNQWIYYSEKLDRLEYQIDTPFAVHSYFLNPHPNCPFCNNKNKYGVEISKSAYDFMIKECAESKKIETGGILIGYKDDDSNKVYVSKSTGPGPSPGAVRKREYFERNVEFCQKIVDDQYEKSNGKSVYVGEWHYHPNINNYPSTLDLQSISEIAVSDNYVTDNPVMIIFSNIHKLSCSVHPINHQYYFCDFNIEEK